MNCFHPQIIRNPGYNGSNLRAHKLGPYIQVDCGRCVACLRKKSRSICFKLDSEQLYSDFPVLWLTLTYNDESCPPDLSRQDVKLFIKRLRKSYFVSYLKKYFGISYRRYCKLKQDGSSVPSVKPLKYWYCGEYGEQEGRPHYHLFLFHFDPSVMDFESIESNWQNGFVYFGDADGGSTVYSTLYSFVQLLNDDQSHAVKPFCVSSTNLGIDWLEKNKDYILSHPERPYLMRNGIKYPFPSSYKSWLERNYNFHFKLDDVPNFLIHEFQLYSDLYGPSDPKSFCEGYNSNVSLAESLEVSKLLRMKKHLNG